VHSEGPRRAGVEGNTPRNCNRIFTILIPHASWFGSQPHRIGFEWPPKRTETP
jgi:hypothetical protein